MIAQDATRYDGIGVMIVGGAAPVVLMHRFARCRRCGSRVVYGLFEASSSMWYSDRVRGAGFEELEAGAEVPRCPRESADDAAHRFPSALRVPPPGDDPGGRLFDDPGAARENFVRAGGDAACACGRPYRDHPNDPADEHLTVACDGTRMKL